MMELSFSSLISLEGFYWIFFTAFIAGVVRGFSGFGTAMIFLPVTGQFLDPIYALTVLAVMDFFGPILLVPQAILEARRTDLTRLLSAMVFILPIALWLLSQSEPEVFRYMVSLLAILLLTCLIFGLRYRGKVGTPMLYGIGACSGFTGGFLGMPGPPVILFYLSGPYQASVVRANTLLFLFSFDILFMVAISLMGFVLAEAVFLGLIMAIPIMCGNLIGARLFDPKREGLYRKVAFCIIAISAFQGLPIFD
tara:strand:- start:466 stop:1221 length:756 start_codon:yes stop_codon:yes gene_type:complete